MSRTQVLLLGTGTPRPDAERVGSGVAIVVDDVPYLVDCGHAVILRVVQAHQQGLIAWDTRHLTRLFVTHLHADHTVGLPDLIFTCWIHERNEPVIAFGPAELKTMIEHLTAAYAENIREHLQAHPSTSAGYKVDVRAVSAGEIYKDERISVEAIAANHGDLTAFSYKFTTPVKTIVISGDTKPTEAFVRWARGCDILIHEVYSVAGFQSKTDDWKAYHSRVHTSSHELAEICNQIQPKLLVLYHQLFWGISESDLLAEIASIYNGQVVSGRDLQIFT